MEVKQIYPTHIKKYTGSYCFNKWTPHSKWCTTIQGKVKSFKTEDEAFEYIVDYNIKHNLPIRNMIYDHGNYLEMKLPNNRATIFDREDLDLAQEHNWMSQNKGYYVTTTIKLKTCMFHNLIMNFTPIKCVSTIDHININPLDNTRGNLRIATQSEQSRNKSKYKNNTSGVVGIHFRKSKIVNSQRWIAHWIDENGKESSKSFTINENRSLEEAKQMAIEHREKMVLHYKQ